VRKTFAIALQRVIDGDAAVGVKPCPDAELVMGVAALLAPVPIPFAIFSHPKLAMVDVDGAFRALAEVSLINTGEDERGKGAFTVHRLVQAVMQDRLADTVLTTDCANLGIELLAAGVPDNANDIANWDTYKALAPHALAVLRFEPVEEHGQLSAVALSSKIGVYFIRIARYAAARPLLERALAVYEKVGGAEHPDTATCLTNLARLLQAEGDFVAARPLYQRGLAIREKVLGPEHPHTSQSLNNLATVLHSEGDLAAAQPLYQRALAIDEKVLGAEHPDTATGLNNLAFLLQAQGDRTAALSPRAGDLGKGARPRASSYGNGPQQRRSPASGAGRPCGGPAAS
jgi:tetratricopeptide (TPR) repeat protein